MREIPSFTSADVRRRVGERSFDRGRRYARDGAVFDLRRQGRTLKASCRGSYDNAYLLHVAFDDGGIAEADCSCPVGDGGFCKHVAALLLTWLDDPGGFTETEPIDAALERRSKEELIGLIRRMIDRHPDLEDLAAMPMPGETDAPVDAAVIERQVSRIFRGDLYEWGAARRVGRDLQRFVGQAEAYAQHGDWASVYTICRAVLEAVVEHYGMLDDENGDVIIAAGDGIVHLGACLKEATAPALRADVAGLLYRALRFDIEIGGVDFGYEGLDFLREHATPAERAALCERIAADLDALPTSSGWTDRWEHEQLGNLLLRLSPDDLDDEAYLRICRTSGRIEDLVVRLLKLDRRDEALAAVRDVSDYDLLRIAPHFVEHGHGEAIDTLVLGRLHDETDRRLVAWIKDRASQRGDADLALRLAEGLFRRSPSVEGYAEAVALGGSLGREAEVRTALRTQLRENRDYGLLTRAYLHDDEPSEALKLIHLPAAEWKPYDHRYQHSLAVADAIAHIRPEEAIQLYLDAVDALVELRGRPNYAEAAHLLKKVRALYARRGRSDDWELFIGEFREGYRSLRALKDELRKAGL